MQAASAFARLVAPPEQRPVGALLLAYQVQSGGECRPVPPPVVAAKPTNGTPAIGLIGPGGFARHVLVPAFRDAGARLELVAGGAGPSALWAVRDLGFARFAESPEALISDPSLDAVVIASRHCDHAARAQSALEAGKHVFCEKPLALSRGELDATIAAARESGRVLAVGFNRRFSPHLRALRDLARSAPDR